jgi:Family of unknown function (DUF5684)
VASCTGGSLSQNLLGASVIHAGIGLFLSIFLALLVVILLFVAFIIVAYWKVYRKMGLPGWASIVPFYNITTLLRVVSYPQWWVFLMFVPVVNIVVTVAITHRLAVSFGKGWWFTLGILLLPFVFLPILAFGQAMYHDSFPPASPMTEATKYALLAGFGYGIFLLLFLLTSIPKLTPLIMVKINKWGMRRTVPMST